jgi:dsRNA-specific ribonuclease
VRLGMGEGSSKKAAEQEAAKEALERLDGTSGILAG